MIARLGMRVRIWFLLATMIIVVLLTAGWIVSIQTLDEGADQLADLMHIAATSMDQRLHATPESAARPFDLAPPVDVRLRHTEPVDESPRAPIGLAVLAELRRLRGSPQAVRFQNGAPPLIWIQSRFRTEQWIGLPVRPLNAPIARASLWILLFSGLVVLTVGAWITRSWSRPLEQLAQRAPDLMAGDLSAADFRDAPIEVRTLAETLIRALARAQGRHAHREEMLIGFSHDLRTPLARLRFAIELDDQNSEQARAGMQADIEEIDALIGAFLVLQRENRDEQSIELDICALLGDLVARFQLRGPIQFDHHDACWLRGYAMSLRRGLSNILQNAFDHAQPPIQVHLVCEPEWVVISIRDSGTSQVDADTVRRGYGIGLGVVRAVAALHGGSFQLDRDVSGSSAQLRLRRSSATDLPIDCRQPTVTMPLADVRSH